MSHRTKTVLPRKIELGIVCIISLLAATVYSNSLFGDFVWDDRSLIPGDYMIKSFTHLGALFTNDFFFRGENDLVYGYYRPVVSVSYLLDFALWKTNAFGFHLTNVVLHVISSLLVVILLLELGFDWIVTLVSGVLFAVHPIHTENVAWISGRTDIVAFVFAMSSLLIHIRNARLDRKSTRRIAGAAFSLLLFTLSLLAKEMSVVLVPWIALVHLLLRGSGLRRALGETAPYVLVVAAYILWRFFVIEIPVPGQPAVHELRHALLSVGPTILRYMQWMLFPFEQSAYVQNPYITSVIDVRFLLSIFIIVVATVAAIGNRNLSHRVRFLLLAVATSFIPIANIIRPAGPDDMGAMMAERFCYFPSVPFFTLCGVVVAAVLRGSRGHRAPRVALAGLVSLGIAFLMATTVKRNKVWKDEPTLFRDALDHAPSATLIWANLTNHYIRNGKWRAAKHALAKIEEHGEKDYFYWSARALWYVVQGRFEKAVPLQEKIVAATVRGNAVALNNLAFLYRMTGRIDRARDILEDLVADGSGYSDVRFNLAEVLRKTGDMDEAREQFKLAFNAQPDSLGIGSAFARIEMESGRHGAAVSIIEKQLEYYPDHAQLLGNLRAVRSKMDMQRRAQTAIKKEPVAVPRPLPSRKDIRPSAVLLVVLDTLRADYVSFMGHDRQTTTFLDSLAEKGVVFTRAYAPASWTVPSMASMHTSLLPKSHGIIKGRIVTGKKKHAVIDQPVLSDSFVTLGEVFKQAGYTTVGVAANRHLARSLGFGQGFDHYYPPAHFLDAKPFGRVAERFLKKAFGEDWPRDWKRSESFIWFHYFDPHIPYSARLPWAHVFAEDYHQSPEQYPEELFIGKLKELYPSPDADYKACVSPLYESEVAYFDEHFKRLARQMGVEDGDVLVVFTSDHGEEFGEHGGMGHGQSVYEELVHVPLMFYWPRGIPEARRVDQPVSIVDIYPTLLELAGVPAPAGLQGESLVPALFGYESEAPRELIIEQRHTGEAEQLAIVRGSWKLIVSYCEEEQLELYNLAEDPLEQRDLADEKIALVRELRWLLDKRIESLPDPPRAESRSFEDPELIEQLKNMGYMGE